MVKDPLAEGVLRVQEHEGPCEGSFEGFECRWQGVPSFNDHKLALLVAAVSDDANVNLDTYRKLSDRIAKIYGDISSYHPLRAERMRLSFSPSELGHEWRVRSSRLSLMGRVKYFARMVLLNLAGVYLFARRMDTSTVRWSRYVEDMVENSDFRKFDGMLRMVMDGSEAQYEDLRSYLEGAAPQRTAGLRHAQIKRSAGDLHRVLLQRKPRALCRRQRWRLCDGGARSQGTAQIAR